MYVCMYVLVLNCTKLVCFHLLTVTLTVTFFFYLGFLSQTFTIQRKAGEGGGYLFNSSLPLPPASQTLRH